jgi:hypothetical protein
MPTNRTRIKRAARSRVTDEARAIFADALKLQGRYWNCISNDVCHSTSVSQHCPECEKYINVSREFNRLLGIKPWETSPLTTNSENPPDYMRNNPWQSEHWRRAWAMRCELDRNGAAMKKTIGEPE